MRGPGVTGRESGAPEERLLPTICVAFETTAVVGDVYLEVGDVEDEIELDSPEDFNVFLMHRGGFFTFEKIKLGKVVRAADWREGSVQVFAHAERQTM